MTASVLVLWWFYAVATEKLLVESAFHTADLGRLGGVETLATCERLADTLEARTRGRIIVVRFDDKSACFPAPTER